MEEHRKKNTENMAKINRSRSKNAKRNIVFGLTNQIVSLIIPFITRTIIIRLLGAAYLGLSGLFSSILQVLNLTELGFGSAIVFSMYKPIARNDTAELCALLKYYKKIYSIVGAAIFAGGLLVLPFLPQLIKGSWPADINIYILYIIYLFNTSISYFLFAYKQSLFTAYQRDDILSKIHISIKILTSLSQIAVLLLWKNYYAYVGVHFAANVVTNVSVQLLSKKAFPELFCKGALSKEKKNEIKTKVKGLMVSRLCITSRNALDSIFVASFIGLIDTAKYNNYFHILTSVSGILSIIGQSILAGVGNSIVTETQEKNHKDMLRMNFIYMWIAGWFSACMICLYQPFTELVFGSDMLFPFSIAVLFTLYFYLLKMGDMRYIYSEAAGLWWENRYRAIAEAIANMILNYTLGKYFGVSGIIAATLISVFFINFLWGSAIIYKHYFTSMKAVLFYKQHAFYAAVCLLAAVITYGLCSLTMNTGILGLLMKGVLCAILPHIVFLLVYHKTRIFQDALYWLDKRFHFPEILRRIIRKRIHS